MSQPDNSAHATPQKLVYMANQIGKFFTARLRRSPSTSPSFGTPVAWPSSHISTLVEPGSTRQRAKQLPRCKPQPVLPEHQFNPTHRDPLKLRCGIFVLWDSTFVVAVISC
jgi:hypothetical protein